MSASPGNMLAGITWDYEARTYTSTNKTPDTVTYRRGGASGKIVAVVTNTLDSDRITVSVLSQPDYTS